MNSSKKYFGFWISVAALAACSSQNNSQLQQLSSDQANRMNAQHAVFDAKPKDLTANTYFAGAQVAETRNDPDTAVKLYQESLKLDPKYLPSLYRLGMLYCKRKQFDEAAATWQQYVKCTGDSASSYSNLAFCYELAGRSADAEETYQKGIAKDPKNLPCRTNYGLMLARQNHIQAAIRTWQPVLTEAEIHYNLASVYQMDGRKLEAKAEYEKALSLDPKLADAKSRLAALEAQ